MKINKLDIALNERQLRMADLYRKAYGKIILYSHKGKYRLLNPKDIIIISGGTKDEYR